MEPRDLFLYANIVVSLVAIVYFGRGAWLLRQERKRLERDMWKGE